MSKHRPRKLPKGAFRLPDGRWATESVGPPDARGRRIRVRAIHRDPPDLRALAQVFVDLAAEQLRHQRDSLTDEHDRAA
jgi:hypothetical protein